MAPYTQHQINAVPRNNRRYNEISLLQWIQSHPYIAPDPKETCLQNPDENTRKALQKACRSAVCCGVLTSHHWQDSKKQTQCKLSVLFRPSPTGRALSSEKNEHICKNLLALQASFWICAGKQNVHLRQRVNSTQKSFIALKQKSCCNNLWTTVALQSNRLPESAFLKLPSSLK